jgi:hypothetical protein
MADTIQYVNYSEFKNVEGVEVQWPFEISEDILKHIINHVIANMKVQEINSNVSLNFTF